MGAVWKLESGFNPTECLLSVGYSSLHTDLLVGENSSGSGKQIKVIRRVIPCESDENQLGVGRGETSLRVRTGKAGAFIHIIFFLFVHNHSLEVYDLMIVFVSVQTGKILLQWFNFSFL